MLEASSYVDAGAYGFDIVDGFGLSVKSSVRLCSRPANIQERMMAADLWGRLDLGEIICFRNVSW